MKRNELRLGNYVIAVDNVFAEVLRIDTSKITMLNYPFTDIIPFSQPADVLKPIPITKEWLVTEFGFNDNGDGYYQHPDYNFFLYHIEEDEYFECYKQVPANDDTGDFKPLQHVHKLQNLFYELFDEELEGKF
ncbi:hypothetical protein [Pedobacter gandavensis]|uniref:hypothetical protein n=1 Tax=Pedobacter gandavensis TaxID=2679963 RepID=UPI00292CE30E|nr:hypothetical protein [Pedobacter gandavensis]